VRLESRRGNDWTRQFPEIVAAAKLLPVKTALLDGEVAVLLPSGTTSFQALQNAFSGAPREGLTYFVFDLVHLDGKDLTALPLEQRKQACATLLAKQSGESLIRYSQHLEVDGPTFLKQACALGAEGIVSKRRDQPYRAGRNEGWLKAKCVKRQEFVIGGFTDPEGSRTGIGSFLVGLYEGNTLLRFAGKVGTGRGFTTDYLRRVRSDLNAIEQQDCPFDPRPPGWLGRNAHWVKPVRTGEVVFTEFTAGGHVRHGSFRGFRDDKSAAEVVREQPAPSPPAAATKTAKGRAPKPPAAPRKPPAQDTARVRGVSITTPERPMYPELGFTKLDLAELYSDLADWMLPYISNRPLTLVRCEKGVRRADALRTECKFLKHDPAWHRWATEPIRRVQIQEQKKVGEYLVVDSPEGLVALIQGDIIELHVWNSTADQLERPDRIVFDLDPREDVEWPRVVKAARLLRDEFAALGLESWPKLTGGKGLHVVLPFRPEHSWDEVYTLARKLAETVVRRDPQTYTFDFSKRSRSKQILIDYKRNHRGAIAVAAYSTRARPNAPLGIPIAWRELKPSLAPDQWTVQNVRQRLKGLKADPWADFWTTRQRLAR
jgi:bifunctional non-homologous end joining protein LigD